MNAFFAVPCRIRWKVGSVVWFLRIAVLGSVSRIGVLSRFWTLTTRFFLRLLPPVCQKFLVLLFIRIKPVPYLVVLYFSNVTLLRETLDYVERTNETAILVSLDQVKALDRVNRGFFFFCLIRSSCSCRLWPWFLSLDSYYMLYG